MFFLWNDFADRANRNWLWLVLLCNFLNVWGIILLASTICFCESTRYLIADMLDLMALCSGLVRDELHPPKHSYHCWCNMHSKGEQWVYVLWHFGRSKKILHCVCVDTEIGRSLWPGESGGGAHQSQPMLKYLTLPSVSRLQAEFLPKEKHIDYRKSVDDGDSIWSFTQTHADTHTPIPV